MENPLHSYRIMVVDSDHHLASVLRQMLMHMGFRDVKFTRSGEEGLEILKKEQFDLLITEWNIQHFSGIELVKRIRQESEENLTLPCIMLTGRAEASDVKAARDIGINEFVVKPFTAKSIFSRLERIVEFPRNFIVCDSYVGPDRRHHDVPLGDKPDRRVAKLIPEEPVMGDNGLVRSKGPQILRADDSLKKKLKGVSLMSIVTPEVLNKAQEAINAITSESLQWIKEDLATMKKLTEQMLAGNHTPTLANELGEVALVINSRGGTFGYKHAASIAYMLYLFCTKQLQLDNKLHQTIIVKHLEVLQVMFATKASNSEAGALIVEEMKNLIKKFAP